jgi:hypothetical protein
MINPKENLSHGKLRRRYESVQQFEGVQLNQTGLCDFTWDHFIENIVNLLLIHVHLFDQDNHNALNEHKLVQAVTLLTCILEVLGSNVGRDTEILTVFLVFHRTSMETSKKSFFPYPSQFTILYHEIISVTNIIVKQTIHKSCD